MISPRTTSLMAGARARGMADLPYDHIWTVAIGVSENPLFAKTTVHTGGAGSPRRERSP